MKSPVRPFRPELEQTTNAAREALAAALFGAVTVKSLLSAAAAEGRAVCLIPAPLDLRSTAAAATIVAWCAKQKLDTEWSRRAPALSHEEAAWDLIVSWGTAGV